MALTWSAAACIPSGSRTLKLPMAVAALAFGELHSLVVPTIVGGTLVICVGAASVSLAK